ncbi:MAG TPA: penicillin-binding protein 2 [Thermomicrobiales bacterium]|nr:penicillin-binding protein 2 [Thermomicrobiales bacterium]
MNRPANNRRGYGPGGGWSGSSNWSPYDRRERLWPKVLLVVSVVGVLIFGSILVASRLTGLNVSDAVGGDDGDNVGAVASPTGETTPTGDQTPGSTISETPVVAAPNPDATIVPSPTAVVDVGEVTRPRDVAEAYAKVWAAGNYDQLYDLLSRDSQAFISREDFVARYEGIAVEVGIKTLEAEITGGDDDDELFPMKVEIDSSRVGTIEDENLLPVVMDGDKPAVDWTPSLIFSQLDDGYVQWTSDVPQRGRILDRKGKPLAQMGQITRVGVVPGKVTNEADLLTRLSDLLDMPQDIIKNRFAGGQADWFMAVKDLPGDIDQAIVDQLTAIEGVAIQKPPARIYPQGELTAHVVGYMSEVTAEELPELSKQGYEAGDLVGRTGLEASAEQWLAGKRGGTLALIGPDGGTIRILGEVPKVDSHDIVLTIDIDLQKAAFDALGNEIGATVILDPNNGEVLAMVSKPSFDPNQFILGVTDEQWTQLMDPQRQPLLNRAVALGTSTGSIFKVITAAAGMAHMGLTNNSPTPCPGEFRLEGVEQVWHDWVPGGQGDMDLHNAIVRSCNTVFYRMGAELDAMDETFLPNMAKSFGLGKLTGLPELYELPGIVPDPDWKITNVGDFWARGDAINLAIGQGYLVATPLQMANVYAAIANGGTLYQPHLLLDIVKLDGTVVQSGEVKENGKLPLTAEQVGWLQSALHDVVNAPNGTAVEPFQGIAQAVSGKTGTEETGTDAQGTNAWFAAYTPSDGAAMANIVFVEKGSAGSKAAAPVSRRIIDAWYTLNP